MALSCRLIWFANFPYIKTWLFWPLKLQNRHPFLLYLFICLCTRTKAKLGQNNQWNLNKRSRCYSEVNYATLTTRMPRSVYATEVEENNIHHPMPALRLLAHAHKVTHLTLSHNKIKLAWRRLNQKLEFFRRRKILIKKCVGKMERLGYLPFI